MLALVIAPVIFSLLGAGVLAFGVRRNRMLLAPLVGVVASGWLAEIGFLFGDASLGVVIGAALGALALLVRPRAIRDLGATTPVILMASLPAIAAILASPFPGVGLWFFDYIEYFAMGRAVRDGVFDAWMIQRPPLFGAATLILEPIARDLPALQAVSAVASTGALLALKWMTNGSMRALWTVAALPLFFLHTVTCWPKMLSAGCVVAALGYFERRDGGSRWAGAFFFAGAVASHTAALIVAPIFIAQGFRRRLVVGDWFRDLVRLAVVLLVVPAPFEFWTVAKFGVELKRQANPVVYYDRPSGLGATFVGNLVGSLTGWPERHRWSPAAQHQFPWIGPNFMKASTFLSWEAGTFLGVLFPLAPLLWRRRLAVKRWLATRWREVIAAVLVIGLNAGANAMVNLTGVTQTGLTPLCLLMVAPAIRAFDRPEVGSRATIWMILLLGIVLSEGVHLSAFAAVEEKRGGWSINDEYLQNRVDNMSRAGLKSILLEFGWPAAATSVVLAVLQLFVVIGRAPPPKV